MRPDRARPFFLFGLVVLDCLIVAGYRAVGANHSKRQVVPTPPKAGEVRANSKDGLKYVWIPPGTFMMGCSPGDSECDSLEKPSHQVSITKGFWFGQTPVTVEAYKRFASATGQQMPSAPSFNTNWTDDNMPIVNVSWDDS